MKLIFLGTGTSTGVPEIGCRCPVCTSSDKKDKRLRCSALLETEGKHILIDCGPDFRAQIMDRVPDHLDGVLITHEHYDHVGGIDDLRPLGRKQPVDLYAEKNVAEAIRYRLPYIFAEHKYPGVPNIDMHIIDIHPFYIDDIKVIPIRLMHGKLPIFGYRIGKMAYLTDLKYIPESEFEKLKNLDVLILNALRPQQHMAHETIAEAIANVKRIQPKHAWFIHMNHDFGLHAVMEKNIPPGISLAYDGLELDI